MTQEQNEPQDGPSREETPAEVDAAAQDAEDAVDLSDLDGPGGMDGALDAIRARGDEPTAEELESIRRTPPLKRNPWLAAVVMVLGLGVMWSMWSDFRFWLRRAPEDLGDASELFDDSGAFQANYDNRWVRLKGTPDVQHAARIEVKNHVYGYVRLQEGRGSLYAMVPREAQRRDDQFEGVFEGRMRRLDRSKHFEEAKAFFDGEKITSSVDLDPKALIEQAANGGIAQGTSVQRSDGESVRVDDHDVVRIVVAGQGVKLQLGVATWETDEAADAAVAALGHPFVRIGGPTEAAAAAEGQDERPGAKLRRVLYRTYVVMPPEGKGEGLSQALDRAAGVESGGADPKVGSASLPQTYTYVTSPTALSGDGEGLVFDLGGNTTSAPYEVVRGGTGGTSSVTPRKLTNGQLRLSAGEISAVRLEQQITLDPSGYVVMVEETPDQHLKWAVLFMVVALVVGINGAAVVIRLRRAALS